MSGLIHSLCFCVTYWVVAAAASALNTIFAPSIHNLGGGRWSAFPWPVRISQWTLNFLGSIVGWIALAYILYWRLGSSMNLGIADLVVLVVAFYGITGYLPYILIQKGLPWR